MSLLRAGGSTRAWRKLRRYVLARDGYSCRFPLPSGELCGRYAHTAGHIVPRARGGTDDPANLRAECAYHNYAGGALLVNGRAAGTPDHYRAPGW